MFKTFSSYADIQREASDFLESVDVTSYGHSYEVLVDDMASLIHNLLNQTEDWNYGQPIPQSYADIGAEELFEMFGEYLNT